MVSWSQELEPSTVSIHATIAVTTEPGPNILVLPGQFTITRRDDFNNALTVFVAYRGSAQSGKDYQALPEKVEIPAGQESVTLLVNGIDDDEVEEKEEVHAVLLPPEDRSYALDRRNSSAVVTIFDSDQPNGEIPVVGITPINPSTSEPAPHIRVRPGEVRLTRRGGNIKERLLVALSTRGSTATSGKDYRALPEFVTFPGGERTLDIQIYALGDDEVEGEEVVRIAPFDATEGAQPQFIVDPNAASASVTIADQTRSDLPVVSIVATVPITSEPAPNIRVRPGELTLYRSGDATKPLVVSLETSGTATAHKDYRGLPGQIEFPAGTRSIELLVHAAGDNLTEGDETIITTVFDATDGPPTFTVDPNRGRATITIKDTSSGDRAIVGIEATQDKTAEPGPLILVVPGEFTVSRRAGNLDEPLSVFLTYSGSATPGKDYNELPRRVEFEAGESTVSFRVLGIDDDEVEEDETIIATIIDTANAVNYVIDRERRQATVTIADTDPKTGPQTISIIASNPETCEAHPAKFSPSGEFTLHRSGEASAELTVLLEVGGTATPREDYRSLPGQVRFPAGERTIKLGVHPTFDTIPEGDETVIATILPPDANGNGKYLIDPDRDSATVTIIDDDEEPHPGLVSIKATRRLAEETASPLRRLNLIGEFTIARSGGTEGDQPVWLHLSGTATAGEDYESPRILVTIPNGEESVAIPIKAIFDRIPEGIETVIATIDNCPPNGLRAPCYQFEIDPDASSATVFIREDGISVASLHLSSPEAGDLFKPGQPVPLRVTAIHLESFITRVAFFAGDKQIGVSEIAFIRPPDPGTPITHGFEWEDAPIGTHVLTARVNDRNAQDLISNEVKIVVGVPNENRPPKVVLTKPQSGDRFPAGESIELIADGADADGHIVLMEFFANGEKIGERRRAHGDELDSPNADQRFPFKWQDPLPGTYVLTTRATDNGGASTDSEPIRISIHERNERPSISVIARDALAIEPNNTRIAPDRAVFRITRHGSTDEPLKVHYELGGDAEPGADYLRLSGMVTFDAGETSVDIFIVPLADNLREGSESVKFALVAKDAYEISGRNRAYAVIRDNPMPHGPNRPRCIKVGKGLIHICFPAQGGICFRLEGSTDLRNWDTMFCLVPVDGEIHFVGENVPELRQRFFRITEEPNGNAE